MQQNSKMSFVEELETAQQPMSVDKKYRPRMNKFSRGAVALIIAHNCS